MSTIEYVMDERFELTGCGFKLNDNAEYFVMGDKVDEEFTGMCNLWGQKLEGVTVVMKHARFDALILQEKFALRPPYIIDVEDLARHYDARMSHKLKDLAKLFKLEDKGDTTQFKGKSLEEIQGNADLRAALSRYGCTDVRLEYDLFGTLLPETTNPGMEIPLARHTLGLYLNPRFSFNFAKAAFLKMEMRNEMEKVLANIGHTNEEISGNITFLKLVQDALPEGESVPMKQGKKKLIPAFAQDDDGMKALMIHPKAEVRNLVHARKAIKSWPLHIKRVQNMMNQARAWGGKIGVPLNYYGGHTGRWSGTEKINLQNLGKRGRAGKGVHPLIRKIRSLLEIK